MEGSHPHPDPAHVSDSSSRLPGMDPDFNTPSDLAPSTPPVSPRHRTPIDFTAGTANRNTKKREQSTKKPYSRSSESEPTTSCPTSPEPSTPTRLSILTPKPKPKQQHQHQHDQPPPKDARTEMVQSSKFQILPCRVSTCHKRLHGLRNLEEHLKSTHNIPGNHHRRYKCPHPDCATVSASSTATDCNSFSDFGVMDHALREHGCQYTKDDLKIERLGCPWGECKESVKGSALLSHILTHSKVRFRCTLCHGRKVKRSRYNNFLKHFSQCHSKEMEKYGVWYIETIEEN